jgi:hypothetical protein
MISALDEGYIYVTYSIEVPSMPMDKRLDKQQYEHEDSAYQYSLFIFTFFISKCL